MSKRINVNPDHYKVAGRERAADAVVKGAKPSSLQQDEERERWQRSREKRRNREGKD